ncbi:hypothetical protein MXL46_08440 [Heyndrickxia sporothermodurans]|uniref:hypothetical protein n=1 Tax=Heyndrickxia sporothermodurans TaxID=46224 RepID=UPI002DBBD902|nr:hypothetical protein [Heyndrickxia sporothermodurans]MEB6549124.1 hypothetical protein [Heyndrickxia sporothermodurans]
MNKQNLSLTDQLKNKLVKTAINELENFTSDKYHAETIALLVGCFINLENKATAATAADIQKAFNKELIQQFHDLRKLFDDIPQY